MSELSTAGIKERFCWVSSGRWWWEGLFLSLLTEILVTLLTKLVSVFLLFQFCPEVRQSWMNGWKAETFLEILIDIWLEMGKLTKYSKSSNRHWLKDVRVSKSPWFFFLLFFTLSFAMCCFSAFSPFPNLHETRFCCQDFSSGPSQLSQAFFFRLQLLATLCLAKTTA